MAEQVSVIRWEKPPPALRVGGRGKPGSRYDGLAEELRANPGREAVIHETPNRNVANSVAGLIREARVRCFEPRGDFDACTRRVDGMVRVYAWYLGDPEGENP